MGGQQCKPHLRKATEISQKLGKQEEEKQEKQRHIKWGIQVRREANTDAGTLIPISLMDKEKKNGQCLLILDSVLIQNIFPSRTVVKIDFLLRKWPVLQPVTRHILSS